MCIKSKLIILLLFSTAIANAEVKHFCSKHHLVQNDTIQNKHFPLIFVLPNNQWKLAVYDSVKNGYVFKRTPITDSAGRQIIPAISIYSQDATAYKQNVTLFSIKKMKPFLQAGVKDLTFLIQENKDYPLTFKNAIFVKGNYSENNVEHIIFMIYIIDKFDTGIQVYLDMTKSISAKYESEFWTTIRSLKEITKK